jgi:CelD/BcsL family acetyltransferase involved in cellulose biosynthesis
MTASNASEVDFPFRLGELTLFTLHRDLVVHDVALDALRGAQGDAAWERILKGGEGHLLRSLPVDGHLARTRLSRHWIRYARHRYERHFIDLAGTYEGYLAKFSAKSRNTLRRKLRRFSEHSGGHIDFRAYRSPEELAVFHGHARCVSRETYQELMFDMGLPSGRGFQAQMAALAREDRVRAFLLFLHGEPISYLYCPVRDGVVQYQFLGYREAYARFSPGTVLLMHALESLFAEHRFQYFDFTEGAGGGGGHKEFFATDSRRCADVCYLRPSISNVLLVLGHGAMDSVSGTAGRTLDRIGLKKGVKQWLRRVRQHGRGAAAAQEGE